MSGHSAAGGRDATTLNTWAIAIQHTLDAAGRDSRALFLQAGLDPAVLQQPDGRYPVAQMQRLWRLAAETLDDPCVGLKVAEHVQPATFHSLGLAILASRTLEDALLRTARFSRIVSNGVDVTVEAGPTGLKQLLRFLPGVPVVDEAIDLFMAAAVKMGRMLTGSGMAPLEIRLRRAAAPGMAERFQEYFRCAVHFLDGENSMLIPYDWARRPLPMANPALALQNDRIVIDYLARFDGARVAEKVRAELISRLPSGLPARAAVAAALHLSEKTLQRRLRDEDTSYQNLLEETRCELARQYLSGAVSVSEVTFRLGFSDQSSFTRAFKRWTGSSPGEFRSGGA